MNQAQGIRYQKRITAACTAVFLTASLIGFSLYLKSAGADVTTGVIASGLFVLPAALIISWFVYSILSFLYQRDPGYSLEEGCYSDSSWLNLIDNQLVFLDKDAIVAADFSNEQADALSHAYQNDSSCQDLSHVVSAEQLRRVGISDIQILDSKTDTAFIEIVSNQETIRLKFKNSGTKAHALAYIKRRLSDTMDVSESVANKASTLKNAWPQLIVCVLFVMGALLAQQLAKSLILVTPLLFLLPGIVEGFFDPAVHTAFKATHAKACAEVEDEPAIRKAA